jgi:hypothetical protein
VREAVKPIYSRGQGSAMFACSGGEQLGYLVGTGSFIRIVLCASQAGHLLSLGLRSIYMS